MLVPLLTTPIETLGVDFIFGGAFVSLVEQCTDEERCIVACAVGEYLLAHNIQLTSKENLAVLTTLFSTIFSQTDPNCYSVLSRVLHLVKLEDDKAQQEVFSLLVHSWHSISLNGSRSSLRIPTRLPAVFLCSPLSTYFWNS